MGEEESPFYGEEIKPEVSVEDFILLDENGEPYALSELEGKVIVIAFLFTRCPDICPIVSANLHYVAEQLGDAYRDESFSSSYGSYDWLSLTSWRRWSSSG